MKRIYIEDREQMIWIPVTHIAKSGKPYIFGGNGIKDDERIQKFMEWCNENKINWMIAETIRG